MWTGTLACGAWLLWDKLDPELQQAVERVVASENDFLTSEKTAEWPLARHESRGKWLGGSDVSSRRIDVSYSSARSRLARSSVQIHDEYAVHRGRHARRENGE